MTYAQFLQSKIKIHTGTGFEVERGTLPDTLLPHAKDSVVWLCHKGKGLIGSSYGMTKTRTCIGALQQVRKYLSPSLGGSVPNGEKQMEGGAPVLVVAPLNLRSQFQKYDGIPMGVEFQYIKNREEQHEATSDYHFINYERLLESDMDFSIYSAVAFDEGSVFRNLASETTNSIKHYFAGTAYKFIFTATPCPNEYLELINYADFLGVMDRGQALTRFFQRDSQKAGNLTLHPHHEDDFWLWVYSWALFLNKPSDLGYSDEGYIMPEAKIHWVPVKVDIAKYGDAADRDGQYKAFADPANGLSDSARIKRGSLPERLAKTMEIVNAKPNAHWLIWHLMENERAAIEKNIPEAVTVYGSQSDEEKYQHITDFSEGKIRILATKPEIAGVGNNFQHYCADAVYMSINDKFHDFIHSVYRILRFMQKNTVNIWIVYAEEEQRTADNLQRKWEIDKQLRARMSILIKKYGLNQQTEIARLTRSFGCERLKVKGENYTAIRNDSVLELPNIASNSIGLIHTSIPFGNHYEYSASYNDFGHNMSNEDFWQQMDFMLPEWRRILKPGRNAIIHVKDRIRYNTLTGLGSYTIDPFSDECVTAMRKHGFLFIGRITIVTDVVRENNQTYRLGWTEKCKDASKMGCGLPEYLLLFRKQQTDLSKGAADEPVLRDKKTFTRAKWQLMASSLWRSSGNRLPLPEDLAGWNSDKIYKFLKMWSMEAVYDWQYHVAIGEALEEKDKLPATYGLLAPETTGEYTWTDINSMDGLNASQNKNKVEKHICPLPFDIVDRVIDCWSMERDTVLDPFAGLMTVPVRSIMQGRKAIGIELNKDYYRMGCNYLKQAEYKQNLPGLFDIMAEEDLVLNPLSDISNSI